MSYKQQIINNAKEVKRLHARIHETFAYRDRDEKSHQEWEDACAEFHAKYLKLAWIYDDIDYRESIRNGDSNAIEYGLQFIEIRPYFFRSGYMYKNLLRILKNANLTASQRKRYERVKEAYDAYKSNKKAANINKS